MANIIEAIGLKKIFSISGNDIKAVDGIDIKIDEGEIVSIMGPSGSGKSTLLHILGLMEKPTSGKLLFYGKETSQMNEQEKANMRNKNIGFVFQFHYLLPEFTLLENVTMPARLSGEKDANINQKAVDLLKNAGLDARLNHTPAQLSGGEQQRAAIVRALINSPKIILADEPTGNLDIETGKDILNLMFGFAKELNTTLVIVTHNPDVAGQTLKTIKLLNGRILM